jgi:hypothetical protein
MSLNKIAVAAMHTELDALLNAFAAKHGLSKGNSRIVYTEATFKFTVEFGDKSSTGDVNPVYFKDCARYGYQYALDTKMIGQTYKSAKGPMKFVGMKGRYAIVQSPDLKFWKQDPAMVKTLLAATPQV